MAPKLRRGPVLCDAGNGHHAALNPQVVTVGPWRGRVICANCALRTYSEATRRGEVFLSEPLAVIQERERTARRRAPVAKVADQELAEVVNLKGGRR